MGGGERRVLSGGTDDTTEDGYFACCGSYRHTIINNVKVAEESD